MNEIKLFNRDGANLRLVQKHLKEIEPYITEWELQVDEKHRYVLEFCRYIGDNFLEPEAIDPSGGPFLAVGDMIRKYQIIKIVDCTTFWLSERNNN